MTRAALTILFLTGLALATALAVQAGLGSVSKALTQIGWAGLGMVCLLQLGTLVLCAAAWRSLTDRASFAACFAARWIRDGVSNLVGFVPAIGEVISARALAILGDSSARSAAASTVVDVAAETLSQALYTILGFIMLVHRLDPGQGRLWLAITLVGAAPLFALFAVSRHPPILAWAERVGAGIAKALGFSNQGAFAGLATAVAALQRQPGRVGAAVLFHGLAWFVGAVQIWAAARGLEHSLGLTDCILLESLIYAARSAFFLVPLAAGVQEGAFVAVGAVIGLDAATAIALSVALRARDLLIGAPAVIFWYVAEGRRVLVQPDPGVTRDVPTGGNPLHRAGRGGKPASPASSQRTQ